MSETGTQSGAWGWVVSGLKGLAVETWHCGHQEYAFVQPRLCALPRAEEEEGDGPMVRLAGPLELCSQ